MRTPTASELLQLWEDSAARTSAERALALLALAVPELGHAGAAYCSIGGRDDMLLALRERLFGDELVSVVDCPACGEAVETRWRAGQLRTGLAGEAPAPLEWTDGQVRVAFRLPTTADLLALPPHGSPATIRRLLLERCIESSDALSPGAAVQPQDLPEPVLDALEQAMAAADPMADIDIALSCPACGHRWDVGFDIVSFLWAELHAWAQRLLLDVHKLARAYGWSEEQILALSPGRRMLYVEMSAS
ncbi:hypothetical protein IP92_01463 [Pseudoduganella flava]|uniref:Phage baseplate protein n=1 Tax=Pseudoduganella flava TaxID=871742 RepID=A0A562Q0Q2_9BURK|nr:hypothetical protein [Pseudoduganella flava]QGZ38234.1 hypothetical protein GO485_03665 [Pseudoduganella flava]TWI50234.1 hypothetical protein IP92_01463 [Pseudoduganella flava]